MNETLAISVSDNFALDPHVVVSNSKPSHIQKQPDIIEGKV